jgi:uncharacterized protein YndB with AHSA1/START domain
MSRITNRITIRRAIRDVFAVLTDVERTAAWFPGDVQEHWTSPPPHGVGSTRHAVVRMWGRTVENDATVIAYDPPFRAVIAGTTTNAPFVATLVFTDEGESTGVEVTTELTLTGAARIAEPLVAAWYGRMWARGLETLRRLMESGDL